MSAERFYNVSYIHSFTYDHISQVILSGFSLWEPDTDTVLIYHLQRQGESPPIRAHNIIISSDPFKHKQIVSKKHTCTQLYTSDHMIRFTQ